MPIGRKKKSPNLGSQSLTAGSYRPTNVECANVWTSKHQPSLEAVPTVGIAIHAFPRTKRLNLTKKKTKDKTNSFRVKKHDFSIFLH